MVSINGGVVFIDGGVVSINGDVVFINGGVVSDTGTERVAGVSGREEVTKRGVALSSITFSLRSPLPVSVTMGSGRSRGISLVGGRDSENVGDPESANENSVGSREAITF